MPTEARIGKRLAGYRIEELIGRGGMGVVYRAEHVHLRRTVALKLLAPELAENEDFRERFADESRVAASIPHPNIVTVYDAGEVEGVLYIAMRFIDGSDLATLLRERRTLDPAHTLWVLRQAASALDTAHACGLVHRDVKPGNVLLDADGAYLSDFGLTKPATARTPYTVPGQLMGTINYAAPEQIRADELSGRTDVYALGCVLYECLAGEVPYPRNSEIAAMYAQLQDPPPTLSAKRPDLPSAIDDVIAQALAKDPATRYDTCCDLMEGAQEALGEEFVPATEAPTLAGLAPTQPGPLRRSLTAAITYVPSSHSWRTLRPSRRSVALLAMATLAATGAVLALTLAGGGKAPRKMAVTTPRAVQPSKPTVPAGVKLRVRSVRTGLRPSAVAVGIGGVWVVNTGSGTLTRVDPVSGTITGPTLGVGPTPVAVAEHSHTLYVADAGDESVRKLDALTSTPVGGPIAIGHVPVAMAVGIGGEQVWVAAADGTVVDVGRGRASHVGVHRVGGRLRGIATARGEAWITRADGTVIRLDTGHTRIKQAPIRVGARPRGIAIGDGVVWVANEGSGTITRLSVRSGKQLGPPIKVGRDPTAVTVGEGYVWVTNGRDGTVMRLVPPSGRRVGPAVRVGRDPVAVRAVAGAAWVANRGSSTVSRLEPRNARPEPGLIQSSG